MVQKSSLVLTETPFRKKAGVTNVLLSSCSLAASASGKDEEDTLEKEREGGRGNGRRGERGRESRRKTGREGGRENPSVN